MPGVTESFTSTELFAAAHAASSSPSFSFSLLSSHPPLPPVPSNFPRSKLIPGTRFVIDGFRLSSDFSVSYFLSHFHSDHYGGLSAAWSRGIVFCSDITARLLQQVLGVSPRFVVPLPLNGTVMVDGCEVTLIDANHCPGAVQFLFKIPGDDRESARYVHTGDFRFCDSMKLEPKLSEFVGCDAVYLDTTYCDPKFLFPTQKESIDYVVGVIDSVMIENRSVDKNVLFLVATYVIGKEKILVEISRRCGRKIHVDGRKMAVLRALGYEDESVFTEDQSATDVRVVGWNVLGETWPYFRPNFTSMKDITADSGYSKVVGFVPTGWTYEVKKNKFTVRTKDMLEIHLVPYSEHSNYNELREYVRFLKPKRVIPTVGSDIENVDSKQAAKIQKHFAGLMDELANKKEFLMGFRRAESEKFERLDGDPFGGASTAGQQEVKDRLPVVQNCNKNEIEPEGGISSSAPMSDSLYNLSLSSEKEREDFMQELQHCLPSWVTQGLMHELIKISGVNVVEAVSYFYEHETEFHERADVSIRSLLTSQSDCKDDFSLLPNLDLPESNVTKIMDIVQNKSTKFPKLKPSVGSDISPGKRRKNRDVKAKKKTRINSNPESESGGKKQSTITTFFTKVTPRQGVNPAFEMDKSCSVKFVIPCDASMSYKQEIEQFIQIIGDPKSSRSYASTLIEKARGDINLALDMYYNGSEIELDDGQVKLDERRKSKLTEVDDQDPSSSSNGKLAAETRKNSPEASEAVMTKNLRSVNLPPERYSPGEHACWIKGQSAPYIHLARTFELVEGEKGKIKATSILCNMFRRNLLDLSPEDVLPAVYLCTNKIAADHENMELNIGGSLVTGALEEVCGTSKSKIREMYNNLGDLGDVAQECRQTQSLLVPPSALLIRDVFSTLQKISLQTGNGSTAKKKSLIVGLLRSCREKEIKFLVRTLVRNLRIGAMMKTVLPALAQAVGMNSVNFSYTQGTIDNLKEKLQSLSTTVIESYNLLPSLDVLVPSLMSKGMEFSSNTLEMVPGIPIRPMLAKITNGVAQVVTLFKNKSFTCEHKYDGQRAQIHKLADGSVRIFSRNGDETTVKFPDVVHIIQDLCQPSAICFILDTEVVAIDRRKGCKLLSFQELSSRERGGKDSSVSVAKIKVDVCIYVFDVMFMNGKQLLSCPLRKRRTYFKDVFNDVKPGYLEYAKEITVEASDACEENEAILSKINAFFENAFVSSCEGIIAKTLDIDARYFPSKRADSWLKVKQDYVDGLNDSVDLVPLGAWHGNGRKAGWYSPFLMACYNPDTEEFESVCRVMSGFSDSFYTEMKEFFSGEKIITTKPVYYRTLEMPDFWFSPELVWQIRGADLTVSPVHQAGVGLVHPSRGISVRFPRFVRSVTDRRPEDCTTSADISQMFRSQTRKMEVGTTNRHADR
ncbi:hypothetical protein V2J09_013309 [Rumex salicifolius]